MRRFIPRWRKATWAIAIFSVLMLIWAISVGSASAHCNQQQQYKGLCKAGEEIGRGIGVTLVVIIWILGFIVLSLIWIMSRPRRRMCPTCGEQVKKGLTICNSCGFDFAAAAARGSVSTPVSIPVDDA